MPFINKTITEINAFEYLEEERISTPLKKKDLKEGIISTEIVFKKLSMKEFSGEKVPSLELEISYNGDNRTLILESRPDVSIIITAFRNAYPNEKDCKGKKIKAILKVSKATFSKNGEEVAYNKLEISNVDIAN